MMSPPDSASALAVIPARYASSRFPGKALVPLRGKPMIQHVVERTRLASSVARVLVATDDQRILQAVQEFGGDAVLTRPDHHSGTERVAEVAAQISAPVYVNVQGDEPLIDPAAIDAAVAALQGDVSVQVATLSVPIADPKHLMDPNVVKVVADFDDHALYFSRAPIPWIRGDLAPAGPHHLKHIGVYVFGRAALLDFPTLPPGDLERLEKLEQLRWLENGYDILVVPSTYDSISVDVPADVEPVEKLLARSGPGDSR